MGWDGLENAALWLRYGEGRKSVAGVRPRFMHGGGLKIADENAGIERTLGKPVNSASRCRLF
jgi:hypothetical protein